MNIQENNKDFLKRAAAASIKPDDEVTVLARSAIKDAQNMLTADLLHIYAEQGVATSVAIELEFVEAISRAILTDREARTGATGRWLPIGQAYKTITYVQDGMTISYSDRHWVRDGNGRVCEAVWSEGKYGCAFWWDFEGESPVYPVEFMPHPLDPRFSAPSPSLRETEGYTGLKGAAQIASADLASVVNVKIDQPDTSALLLEPSTITAARELIEALDSEAYLSEEVTDLITKFARMIDASHPAEMTKVEANG